jgi:hypothetical protein
MLLKNNVNCGEGLFQIQIQIQIQMVVTHLLLESLAASWLESYHFNIGMKVLVLLLQFTTK